MPNQTNPAQQPADPSKLKAPGPGSPPGKGPTPDGNDKPPQIQTVIAAAVAGT